MQKCNTDLLQKIKKRASTENEGVFIDTLSIVIPVLNNGNKHLISLLEKIALVKLMNDIKKEIIIIDDGLDNELKQLITNFIEQNQKLNIKLFRHPTETGKTAAIKTGIRNTTGEFLIIQENNLIYQPSYYNDLLSVIINEDANVVFGVVHSMSEKPQQSFINKIITSLLNRFTPFHFTDVKMCYKLFDTKLLKEFKLTDNRLGFEWEIVRKMTKNPSVRFIEKELLDYDKN